MTKPPTWSFAVPDWYARMQAGTSLVPDLPLDRAEADRAAAVFNRLRLPDVVGTPLLRDATGDWFRDIVRAVFGSYDPTTGLRGVSDVLLMVPKKNSKTTSGAGLMLTALLLNRRPLAQFALFGPTQEIADLAFKAASGMVNADPDLKVILHVREHNKTIEHRTSGAVLKITTFDPSVATGGKLSGWLLDELHILGSSHYAARVIGQLRGARAAIPESFGVIITTQAEVPPAGVFKAEIDVARKVRDGQVTGLRLLPVLYELPEEIQAAKGQPWRDPALWRLVNPNWGRSVNTATFADLYAAAVAMGDEDLRRWASQHVNLQIGVALHTDRWRGADYWEAASEPGLTLETLIQRSEVCTVGIDGGGLDDLLGFCVIGREAGTGRWLAWCQAWCDEVVKDRRQEIAPALEGFARDGDLAFVDLAAGEATDFAELASIVARLWEEGLLPARNAVGCDAAGIASIVDAITDAGVPLEALYAVPQGYRLNGVIKATARKLMDGSLRHAPQPLMDWCVGNAKILIRGNAEVMEKQVSGRAKIDPLIAFLNAADAMGRNPQATAQQAAPWEDPSFRMAG